MYKASELVKFAKSMIGQPYWYGTCVYPCTHSLLDRKEAQYPKHYTASRMSRYEKDIKAKSVCMDCVGLIKGFFWTKGGKGVAASIGTSNSFYNEYGCNGMPDKSADGLLSWLKTKGCAYGGISSLPETPGVLLFSPGHVGVYVGNGYAVEARGFAYGVVETRVVSRNWKHWAELPAELIDYSDAAEIKVAFKVGERVLKKVTPMMTGTDVLTVQKVLNVLGYNCGTPDGEFGRNTEKGVKKFQKAHNLEADGIVGPKTLEKLREKLKALIDLCSALMGDA